MKDARATRNDRAVVSRCLRGDSAAFEEIVRHYEHQAFRIAYRLLDCAQDAEDAVQETFLRAYRSLSSWRGERLAPWLFRILVNICTDERRRRRRAVVLPLARDLPANGPPDPGLRQAVRLALSRLPPRYRLILILRDVEGYSTRETSEILELKEGTARVLLLRARRRLAEELSDLEGSGRK